MRGIFVLFVILALVSPTILATNIISAQSQHKALILSSLERLAPMDVRGITTSLTKAGYTVTFVADTRVTLDLLAHLDSYEIVIWRTNVYEQAHVTYWYVGELYSQGEKAAYASDFALRWVDSSRGILGASAAFFGKHLSSGSLSHLKLAILVSSMSSAIARFFVLAGVRSVIYYSGIFSLQFTLVDYVTSAIVRFLERGYDVADSISNAITPLVRIVLRDPIDSIWIPQVSYSGDPTLTIT